MAGIIILQCMSSKIKFLEQFRMQLVILIWEMAGNIASQRIVKTLVITDGNMILSSIPFQSIPNMSFQSLLVLSQVLYHASIEASTLLLKKNVAA